MELIFKYNKGFSVDKHKAIIYNILVTRFECDVFLKTLV